MIFPEEVEAYIKEFSRPRYMKPSHGKLMAKLFRWSNWIDCNEYNWIPEKYFELTTKRLSEKFGSNFTSLYGDPLERLMMD